jgi:hypothetical protein
MILHENKKKFHSAIQMAAAALKIKPHFVEKDYWICRNHKILPKLKSPRIKLKDLRR